MLPPRIVLYGPSKIGISTFCAQIPNAYFMDVSGTIDHLSVQYTRCRTYEDCQDLIKELTYGEHTHKTLVIDNLLGLENLIANEIFSYEKENKAPAIEYFDEIPYGRGPGMVLWEFKSFLDSLDDLRVFGGVSVVIAAHEAIEEHNLSFCGPMSFSKPNMVTKTTKAQSITEEASSILTNWADCVLYVAQQNQIKGNFFGKKGSDTLNEHPQTRSIFTERRPAFEAGNRYGLPYEIPFEWKDLDEEIKKFTESK